MQGFEHMYGRPESGVSEPGAEEWTVRVQSVMTEVLPVAFEPAHMAKTRPSIEPAVKAPSQGRCGQKCKPGDQREHKRRTDVPHLRSPLKRRVFASLLHESSKTLQHTANRC